MNPEAVLKTLETTIKKVSRDIRQKSTVGAEKLDSLSKLTNAYSRLLERHKQGHSNEEDDDHSHLNQSSVMTVENMRR